MVGEIDGTGYVEQHTPPEGNWRLFVFSDRFVDPVELLTG
jgi:hypothetical protein